MEKVFTDTEEEVWPQAETGQKQATESQWLADVGRGKDQLLVQSIQREPGPDSFIWTSGLQTQVRMSWCFWSHTDCGPLSNLCVQPSSLKKEAQQELISSFRISPCLWCEVTAKGQNSEPAWVRVWWNFKSSLFGCTFPMKTQMNKFFVSFHRYKIEACQDCMPSKAKLTETDTNHLSPSRTAILDPSSNELSGFQSDPSRGPCFSLQRDSSRQPSCGHSIHPTQCSSLKVFLASPCPLNMLLEAMVRVIPGLEWS